MPQRLRLHTDTAGQRFMPHADLMFHLIAVIWRLCAQPDGASVEQSATWGVAVYRPSHGICRSIKERHG